MLLAFDDDTSELHQHQALFCLASTGRGVGEDAVSQGEEVVGPILGKYLSIK